MATEYECEMCLAQITSRLFRADEDQVLGAAGRLVFRAMSSDLAQADPAPTEVPC